jgi:hypothetical protein
MSYVSSFQYNDSSAPNCNAKTETNDILNIKNNIENYLKNILIPKYFEGREFSYQINKWHQDFLDDLELFCKNKYKNYKFYFWVALYDSKNLGFNSSDRVHFYSETDCKISFYESKKNIWLDIGGFIIKNLNLTHSGSINDFKKDLRDKIERIIEKTFEGRTFSPGDNSGGKYINYILDDVMEFLKSQDNFPYYYAVGTIMKKEMNHSICEKYFNQTSNYGSVYVNYENKMCKCNIHVFSCI